MIIVYDSSVGTDGDINPCLFIISISGLRHIDQRRGLSSSDALLLPGNTDGASADSYLDKISPGLCQETEALSVHHISGSYLYLITIIIPYVVDRNFLPLRKAFRTVNTKDIRTRFQQSGNPFRVVPCVNAGSGHIALGGVDQFVLIIFMGIIIFPENKVNQFLILIYQRQAVNFMLPDNIIGFL